MKKLLTALLIAMPLTACDASKDLREENQRLVLENQDLKVRLARLEERAKATTAPTSAAVTAAASPAKPKAKPKAVATKAPDEASPEEKAALTQAATGGGSFK